VRVLWKPQALAQVLVQERVLGAVVVVGEEEVAHPEVHRRHRLQARWLGTRPTAGVRKAPDSQLGLDSVYPPAGSVPSANLRAD